MRKTVLKIATGLGFAVAAPIGAPALAQEAGAKPCGRLTFNLREGTLNDLGPATPMKKVKKRLPCSTGESREGAVANHGGGVFFTNDDFYFYTYLRFFELRAGFSGETRPRLFGRTREELTSAIAFLPVGPRRPYWATAADEFMQSRAGCIQMTFDGSRLARVRSFSVSCDSIRSVD